MNLDKFRREFSQLVLRGKELKPLTPIKGTNSPLIQHTINLAVECLEDGEAYFEVGCLFGSSLDSANHRNDNKQKYCCDMQWQGEMPRLVKEMPNLSSIESKFEDVDLKSFLKHPVGVHYFDGPHDFEPSYMGLSRILPYLADKALILYDDIDGYGRAYNAWRKFARDHANNVTVVHEFWTPDQFIACTKGYPDSWWDGFGIAEFEKFPGERDESIEDTTIQIWHGMGPHKARHGTLHPREFKHLHGQEEHFWE
jgi:hypothetical protein